MARGGGNNKKFSVELIRRDEVSEVFKVSQDAIPLILNCRTMFLSRTIVSSTSIILDVHSIYTPSPG